jgi:hypothetical protein
VIIFGRVEKNGEGFVEEKLLENIYTQQKWKLKPYQDTLYFFFFVELVLWKVKKKSPISLKTN